MPFVELISPLQSILISGVMVERRTPSPRQRRQQAFTLIELLVVMVIIAVLAARLFPVLTRVKEKARQTSCLNNLGQISLAYTMYRGDNRDFNVPYRYSPDPPNDPYGAAILILTERRLAAGFGRREGEDGQSQQEWRNTSVRLA